MKVAPSRDIQVFYDNSLPEAIATNASEYVGDPRIDTRTLARKPRKNIIILSSVAAALIVVALGVGLGLGLSRHKENGISRVATPPSDFGTTTQSSAVTTSAPAQASATHRVLQHRIMMNTPIAATTLSNGNRHLYFQDMTGAFRRAIYSSQAKLWQSAIDAQLPSDSMNNTSLAGVTGLNIVTSDSGSDFSDADPTSINTVTLFYINSTNHLSCIDWGQSDSPSCSIAKLLPKTSVAPEAHQISAMILMSDQGQKGILLTYQDSSQRPVIMLGFAEAIGNYSNWTWRNETGKLTTDRNSTITACSAGWRYEFSAEKFFIYCFGASLYDKHYEELNFDVEFISPGNLTIGDGWFTCKS
ncbi:MAG: hypothetical protein Q9209_001783 [Squamulea sp. 1 TL-2023]